MKHNFIVITSGGHVGIKCHLMTIQAQQSTGSASTGGNLILTCGTGTFKFRKENLCQPMNTDATPVYMNGKITIPLKLTLQRLVPHAKPKVSCV